MPRQVDHDARRAEIASAMWRVVSRDGVDAATVRNVAEQAGVSPGRVQHYFVSKDDMIRFALDRVAERFAARLAERIAALGASPAPRDVVRTVLVERLPRDAEQHAYVHVLLAWLGQADPDSTVAASMLEGTERLRDYLAGKLREAGGADGDASPRVAAGLVALTDGLISHIMQGILDPPAATAVIDEYLDLLMGRAPTP